MVLEAFACLSLLISLQSLLQAHQRVCLQQNLIPVNAFLGTASSELVNVFNPLAAHKKGLGVEDVFFLLEDTSCFHTSLKNKKASKATLL